MSAALPIVAKLRDGDDLSSRIAAAEIIEAMYEDLTVARQLAYAAGRDDLVAEFDATLAKAAS